MEIETTSSNIVKSLEIARKVKDFPPIAELKTKVISENKSHLSSEHM
jgi:hypothetical protein